MTEFRAFRVTEGGTPVSFAWDEQAGPLLFVDDQASLEELVKGLTGIAGVLVSGERWTPPEGMSKETRIKFVIDANPGPSRDLVSWRASESEVAYRVRPGADMDTTLNAIVRAVNEVIAQGWAPAGLHLVS